jgi:UDP-2,3-diacylglucosamine pyrophosphatase LpxH
LPEITYEFIPGNHDRLAQYSQPVRQVLVQDLGLAQDPADKFKWIKYYPEYSVLALHGHVLNPTDFGRDEVPDDLENSAWYDVPSFGDVATVNFGVGIVQDFLKIPALAQDPMRAATLGEIDLVRPQSGALRWLSKWGFHQPGLKNELDRIVVTAFKAMMNDEFAEWRMQLGWLEKAYLWMTKLETVEDVMNIVEKQASGPATVEEYNKSMVQAIGQRVMAEWVFRKCPGVRNIVSGHTHQPGVIPLQGETGANIKDEMVYFNTGTWLPVIEAGAMKGFARRSKIVHITFYKDGEDEDQESNRRSYWEYWEGNLREGPIV